MAPVAWEVMARMDLETMVPMAQEATVWMDLETMVPKALEAMALIDPETMVWMARVLKVTAVLPLEMALMAMNGTSGGDGNGSDGIDGANSDNDLGVDNNGSGNDGSGIFVNGCTGTKFIDFDDNNDGNSTIIIILPGGRVNTKGEDKDRGNISEIDNNHNDSSVLLFAAVPLAIIVLFMLLVAKNHRK